MLEDQGLELENRKATMFRRTRWTLVGQSPGLLQYGLTRESQFRVDEQLCPHLSSTSSFEAVYKALLGGEGRLLLPQNLAPKLGYRNGLVEAEANSHEFELNTRFLPFEEDSKYEAARRKEVGN